MRLSLCQQCRSQGYQKIVDQVKHFSHGGHVDILKDLKREKMGEAIETLEFERAAELRIRSSNRYRHDATKMTLTDLMDRDVFGYSVDKGWMCVQVFIRQGKLIERKSLCFLSTMKRMRIS